jgi:hypothetical protein
MSLYNVLVEYSHFEDEDNNYSEIRGTFSTKEKAIKQIKELVKEEKEVDMKISSTNMTLKNIDEWIENLGYVTLEQECGWGETRIILSENELDKESV